MSRRMLMTTKASIGTGNMVAGTDGVNAKGYHRENGFGTFSGTLYGRQVNVLVSLVGLGNPLSLALSGTEPTIDLTLRIWNGDVLVVSVVIVSGDWTDNGVGVTAYPVTSYQFVTGTTYRCELS